MKFYNFKKEGNVGHVYIFGMITAYAWTENGEHSAKTFLDEFSELENTCDEIVVHLNSPGGDVFEGLAICSIISSCKKKVTTKNEGIAFSMTAVVLCAAANVVAYKNSLMMFHSASASIYGNSVELAEMQETLSKVDETLAGIISARSGKSVADIKSTYFDGKDHYLSADDALELGFITSIEDNSAILPKNVSDMHDRKAVIAAYCDKKNFQPAPNNLSLLDRLLNRFTQNNKVTMNQIIALLQIDAKSDEAAIVSSISAIIKARDEANAQVTTLTDKVTNLEQSVTDITAERDRLQVVVDKIADGEGANAAGGDTPPGGGSDDFKPSDPVNAQAKKLGVTSKKK